MNLEKIKEVSINALGLFFIAFGTFAIDYAIYRGKPEWILWLCYIGMIVIGFGIFFRNGYVIVSQLNILTIPLLLWMGDFFYRLTTGGDLFGITAYFFNTLLPGARIISFEHFFLLPLAYVALYHIRPKQRGAWKLSIIQICVTTILLYWFTAHQYNVNCVFTSCLSFMSDNITYPFRWLALIIIMIITTDFIITKLFVPTPRGDKTVSPK